MGQPCADKITFIQRKYLRLILKSAERRTADDPVIVFLKLTSQVCASVDRVSVIPTHSLFGKQSVPFHFHPSNQLYLFC